MTPEDLDALWARYREHGDLESRNRLVEHYLPIVDQVAGRLAPFLARQAERRDLTSYGMIGLIDAVSRFDPGQSGNFVGFAWKRIKGEIMDELRRSDHTRRSLRRLEARIERARDGLTSRLQREPSTEEVAAEMGVTLRELYELMSELAPTANPVPLERQINGAGPEMSLLDVVSNGSDDLGSSYEIAELRDVLAAAWNTLPPRERTIAYLRYVEGKTLTEIGAILEVATSRVSQLQTEAVRLLRQGMAGR